MNCPDRWFKFLGHKWERQSMERPAGSSPVLRARLVAGKMVPTQECVKCGGFRIVETPKRRGRTNEGKVLFTEDV